MQIIKGETAYSRFTRVKPLDQITSESDILARFWSMYGQARENAAEHISRENRNWMMFLGKHFLTASGQLNWIEEKRSPTHTRYRREIIQPTIELLRSVLVKAFPVIRIKPDYEYANLPSLIRSGEHEFIDAKDLQDSDVAAWSTDLMMTEMEVTGEAIKQAELTCQVLVGGEAYRLFYTRHIPGFSTDIRSKLLKRDQFLGDPKGTDLEEFSDFEYIIIEEELDAANIKRLYGVDERSYSYQANKANVAFDEFTALSSTSRAWYPNAKNDGTGTWRWDQRTYKVHTIYYNMGNVNATIFGVKNNGRSAELNYPMGREIVIINYSKVASDIVNPHWHGEFPIVCYQSSPLPCMAKGLSEVEKIADDQVVMDIINNVVLWNALAHANHTIVYEEGSVNPALLRNEPALKLPVRPGANSNNQIVRWEPGGLEKDLYAYAGDTRQHATEFVAGATEALQGNQLPAGSSGELYRSNVQAGLSRHSFKSHNLEPGHRRAARLWFSDIQQHADLRGHRYARYHDISRHPYIAEALKELFWDVDSTSMADLPPDFQTRHDLAMLWVQNGYYDLEQMQQMVNMPMRPALRKLIRDTSIESFIPGIPANIQAQLRLQAAQLLAQQQQAENGGAQVPNLAQGNPPPLPPGNPNALQR